MEKASGQPFAFFVFGEKPHSRMTGKILVDIPQT